MALGELVRGSAVIDDTEILAVDFAGKVINLEADINLVTGNWKTIGKRDTIEKEDTVEKKDTPSASTFNGKAHSITGLNINSVSDNQGLFGYTDNATIKNLSVSGAVYSTGKNTGGIVVLPQGHATLRNCPLVVVI